MPVNETTFAYAVGRIRALETRLLDKSRFDRMVEAASGEEALKVMSETDYGGSIAELDRVHDFEIILQEELKRTFALVKQISPQPHLID